MTATHITYVIRTTRHYYGPADRHGLVMHESGQRAKHFATPAEANQWIAATNDARYYLEHNEASRPTYRVVRADRLPAYLAVMRAINATRRAMRRTVH